MVQIKSTDTINMYIFYLLALISFINSAIDFRKWSLAGESARFHLISPHVYDILIFLKVYIIKIVSANF
jgi:hypothetical protein